MSIEVKVLGKYKMSNGVDVDIEYKCPHCGERVTECISFHGGMIDNCVANISSHECPECGERNELDVDLY